LKNLGENVDAFGLPAITEGREGQHALLRAEDARDQLERAKTEVNRALDHLREVQKESDPKGRGNSEVKSAINAVIECEKAILTAIHKAENVLHRVRKAGPKEESAGSAGSLTEQEVSVNFPLDGKAMCATYDVDGTMERNGEEMRWLKPPKLHLIAIHEANDQSKTVDAITLDPKLVDKLESCAVKEYAKWYEENQLNK
jgi:hypothetical protein